MKTPLVLVLGAALAASAQSPVLSTTAGEVKIEPLYHASLLLEAGGKHIYVDPAPPARIAGLPKADLIVITHLHPDHFNPAYLHELSQPGTVILAPASVAAQLPGAEVMANGQIRQWQGWTIEAVPAYNLQRGPAPGQLFHPKGRDNGYVLSFGGKRIYLSGDTEGTPEMRALKNIDLAFVCMNLPYTMPPEEAAEAVRAFHPHMVIPYHYRNSNLSLFERGLAGSGIEVRFLEWYPAQ